MRKKAKRTATVHAPEPEARAESPRQKLLIRIGILFPLVLLAISLARGASENRFLPEYLLGVWESADGNYDNCYIEIRPATIIFGNAQGGDTLYFVTTIEQVTEAGQSFLTVHYADLDGVKYEMSINYQSLPQPTLHFKNQPRVTWKRRADF